MSAVIESPESAAPLFFQEIGAEADKLDARRISRMFAMSTGTNVVVPDMDFIPEVIWHGGIEDLPLKRIYDILVDFSGSHPVVIPKLRDVTYLNARAFAHIILRRRCITQCEDHKQNSWKALRANHCSLSPPDYGPDSDLETTLFLVDMTLGYDVGFL